MTYLREAASELLCIVQNGERESGELYKAGCRLEAVLRETVCDMCKGEGTDESTVEIHGKIVSIPCARCNGRGNL